MKFTEFGFEAQLQEGLDMMGFVKPTPIQEQAIPAIKGGQDMIACAQTGTGKTAAFILPILNDLCKEKSNNKVNTLIIAPTRELAQQIDQQIEGFSYFTNSSSFPIYGGGSGDVFDDQKKALVNGTDIIISTPGRLMSHMIFDYFDTSGIKHFILDEADRMLDMGFYDDIMAIAKKLPEKRQNLLFSATMPPKIRMLANKILTDPVSINIAISKPAAGILQATYLVHNYQKIPLIESLLKGKDLNHILIFASTKKNVREITRNLNRAGIPAESIHSDLEQAQREDVLLKFKSKEVTILVATDVLSRGIDIKGIELVINFEVPRDAEDYVHRIGRTARADLKGTAITFINSDDCDSFMKIEELIEKEVPKLPLPEGFEKGPEYISKRKKKGSFNKNNKFKKRGPYRR